MKSPKRIALVAHDHRKKDLLEWVAFNADIIKKQNIVCTGTTGKLVKKSLKSMSDEGEKLKIKLLKSGPLGGDQQLGAMIAENKIDMLIFFWDPMEPQPHEVDVKALLRIAVLYNIPTACNRSTADFIISSELMSGVYQRKEKDYSEYLRRKL